MIRSCFQTFRQNWIQLPNFLQVLDSVASFRLLDSVELNVSSQRNFCHLENVNCRNNNLLGLDNVFFHSEIVSRRFFVINHNLFVPDISPLTRHSLLRTTSV
jgi:hypothetical protein